MFARRKKISAHCIAGYRIWAEGISSPSPLPIIVAHLFTRAMLLLRAISITNIQYSFGFLFISSEAQRNSTFSRSIPAAFHTSTMYSPTFLIFFKSPPILLLSIANQSATQKINLTPHFVSLFTLIAFKIPCAMCIRPLGSNPSYALGLGCLSSRFLSSSSWMHSAPTDRASLNLSSRVRPEGWTLASSFFCSCGFLVSVAAASDILNLRVRN
mmetsp:Transcript_32231/g.44959  ORF Transcript_32231/g.44959 Transcript_32231/m.44959 type:complete len:213 (+) Transcript_32231:861-1499(+)